MPSPVRRFLLRAPRSSGVDDDNNDGGRHSWGRLMALGGWFLTVVIGWLGIARLSTYDGILARKPESVGAATLARTDPSPWLGNNDTNSTTDAVMYHHWSSPSLDELDVELSHFGIHPRAFPLWQQSPNRSLDCTRREGSWDPNRNGTYTGIIFVKPLKVGSTTAASVTMRIARTIGQQGRNLSKEPCNYQAIHGWATQHNYQRRDPNRSIMWSIVREPTARTVSAYFHFQVSRRGAKTSDHDFQHFLHVDRENLTNLELNYLSLHPLGGFPTAAEAGNEIQNILHNYDFIAVSERMDESLVALQLLLGLDASAVLHLSSKVGGGYDDGRFHGHCVYIVPSIVTPGMATYFSSDEWQPVIQYDRLLHHAVNRSLDMTIDALGRSTFDRALAQYRRLQAAVHEACGPIVRFPCTSDGVLRDRHDTDCVEGDWGCGFDCMDDVLLQLDQQNAAGGGSR